MSVTSSDRQGLARHLHQNKLDLVILDIRQDRGEKLLLLRQILSASIPVIITNDHRCAAVAVLELGADDYISEPLAPRELVARVRAILRRRGRARVAAASGLDLGGFRFADLTLDLRTRHLTRSDETHISLSNREYALLHALLDRAGRTLTREHLVSATRLHQDVFDRTIDVLVLRLRRKLEGYPGAPRIIETKRGIGYAIEIAVQRLS